MMNSNSAAGSHTRRVRRDENEEIHPELKKRILKEKSPMRKEPTNAVRGNPEKKARIEKPKMKTDEKPTKSPSKRSHSEPRLTKSRQKRKKRNSSDLDESDPELHSDGEESILQLIEEDNKTFKPVTPQMLVSVLDNPALFNKGASVLHIVKKLRAHECKELDPDDNTLTHEVHNKLLCALYLGFVVLQPSDKGNMYRLGKKYRTKGLSRFAVECFWQLYDGKPGAKPKVRLGSGCGPQKEN